MDLIYTTSRMNIFEISSDIDESELSKLLVRVPELLSPAVVENLPPYFHSIKSQSDAQVWFERMVSESRLFLVKHNELNAIIGFVFAFIENDGSVHIGYLLGKNYWGQGLATELLRGFIDEATKKENWVKLIAGVDQHNQASSKLLLKLGFHKQLSDEGKVIFYEYPLSQLLS